METAPLKFFATWARTALIREVTARIAVVLAPASPERVEQTNAVAALEKAVKVAGGGEAGRVALADKVAYTWFNRIIALRFMDANGYTGIGVVSPERGRDGGQPEVLAEAKRGNIDSAGVINTRTVEAVTSLFNGARRSDDPQGEAYALLLAEYCRHWNRAMPFMFEREGDFTELLIPANLLADDSVLARAVTVLTEDVCRDVEVIGWLYQFYISERKDEVFAGFKKNQKAGAAEIPAATQLFTPHWIVRYLVENSLGRLWLLNRPTSRLAEQMDYYIAPVDEENDFLRVASPEELKVIDPACGSGHMLTYAFDLLYSIYEEEGYAPSDIPGLILANNLYGTEIDPRAGSLAAFALMMKARGQQRTFFTKQVAPNICVLEAIVFTSAELDVLETRSGDRHEEVAFWNQFEHAHTFGALIRPDPHLTVRLRGHIANRFGGDRDLLTQDIETRAQRVVAQAEALGSTYALVITNPPYMGSKNMSANLLLWVKDNFPEGKQDLYGAFTLRGSQLARGGGIVAMITGDTWMTIKTFEGLRKQILERCTFHSVLHLQDVSKHSDTFGANAAFVFTVRRSPHRGCLFVYLDPLSSEAKRLKLLEAIRDQRSPWAFQVQTDHFYDVPGSPFAYRLSEATRRAFRECQNLGTVVTPLQGLATADDGRFLRRWWEVSRGRLETGAVSREDAMRSKCRWFPFTKGGKYRRWYGNNEYVVNWESDGAELDDFRPRAVIRNPSVYFRQSVTWGLITAGAASFRYSPKGFVFGHKGPAIVAEGTRDLLAVTAFANSSSAAHFLQILSPTLGYEVGHVANLPIPPLSDIDVEISEELVAIAKADWDSSEISWEFTCSATVHAGTPGLRSGFSDAFASGIARARRVAELELLNDERISAALGLALGATAQGVERVSLFTNPLYGARVGARSEDVRADFYRALAEELISYSVGCMFGRYSIDQPGLILADQGDTLQEYLARVPTPTFKPDADNVIPIVDGDWFEDDVVARFRRFLRAAFGDQQFEENLRFVTESLGVKDLRDYFVRSFYKDHVQRYKKRPIYWLFSSPKGSFNALIYMHRYTPSTASTVLNEYLREFRAKLDASRQHHERLAVGSGTPRQQATALKEVDRIRKVLLELDEYEHDVLYPLATQQVQIDLDDGVKANYPKFGAALKKIPGLEVSDE
jgi:hypothetical protein